MADQKLSKQATGKRKSTQPKLSNFFSKSIKKSIDSSPSGSGRNSVDETPDNTKIDDSSRNTTNSSDLILAEAVGASVSVYDIGNFVGRPIDDDFTKEQLLVKHWKPPKDYVFPCVVVKKNGKDSYRRPSHDLFTQFEWLVFSEKQNGLFCVYCALFASTVAGGNTLKNLVTKPVSDYKHLLGKDGYLTTHSNNVYHRTSIEKGKEFLRRINNPNLQLEHQLNKQNQDNIVENREKLKSILKCVLFLGVQNIPFRGHRDDGDVLLNSNSEENASNDGNFRELIRFRIDAGDSVLAKHLEAAPGNAKYTSKTVQNELISCCAEEITETILARVNQSKWFSIVFDETTDVSHQSQLTFALRYVYENNIYEDFIGFLNPREEKLSHENEQCARVVADKPLTGEAIGSIVLNLMEKYGLSKTDCVGVATDGCSTMVSEAKGAVSTILKTCKNAVHCICFNHALNLTVSKSSKVIHVKRCLGVIKSVVAFFTASSKRNTVLKDIVGRQLIQVCETRWIERQTSIFLFQKHLQGINDALIRVSEWDEVDTATTAHSLHLSLMDSSFIVTIKCLTNIMSIMLPLSRLFQKKTIDVNFARNAVKETTDFLQEKRQKSNEAFRILFSEAEELATSLNTNISIPRLANKQTKRDNYTTDNPMDYYRVAVFNPILYHVLSDVKDRFSSTKSLVVHNFLAMFIPAENKLLKNLVMNAEVKIKLSEIANEFSFVVESRELLEGEFLHWSNKWMMAEERREKVPDSALQALKECDEDIYPTINALLRILCSLPVSVATAERSFSTLRLVKDWMRSTMTENRLNGLCSIYVHRDIVKKLSYDKIIDRFAKKNKRRLGLIL